MFLRKSQVIALLLSTSSAKPTGILASRQGDPNSYGYPDTPQSSSGQDDPQTRNLRFGPGCSSQDTSSEIISTSSTMYPGKMPSNQQGFLFTWIGIEGSAQDSDLIQSIVGSYPAGLSECQGPDADTTWCVSSEVYGLDDSNTLMQFVGDQRTADTNYQNGIIFNYTLIDQSTYLWRQTMTDAVTGDVLSTYQKTSSAMTKWNTAVELQNANDNPPTSITESQTYVQTTITLAAADPSFGQGISSDAGADCGQITTPDNGVTVS